MPLTISIQKVNQGHHFDLPSYATAQSSGMDLKAAIKSSIVLEAGHRCPVPAGIAIALPYGLEGQIRSRSGLALKNGVVVLNSPGTIDADYRGEIIVILQNHGHEPFIVEPGMRIAQLIIMPVEQVAWKEEETLPLTERNQGNFGSTGL